MPIRKGDRQSEFLPTRKRPGERWLLTRMNRANAQYLEDQPQGHLDFILFLLADTQG